MAKVALPVTIMTARPLRKMGGSGANFGTATFGTSTFGGTRNEFRKKALTIKIS